ncbi:MAG: photosynthetic reaction center cytochrome c subunit, partial [Acetobacteraceae bacterium]|nr:photosynthetic reaction center cytochrome c subunit [Acetobacteraceae bacterium]
SVWFPRQPPPIRPMIAKPEDWNEQADTVRKFFPTQSWEEYLLQNTPGLAESYTALPSGEVAPQIVVKRLYEYMMQMSDGIGVNCGYCHNSRDFADWSTSTPERWTGYYGIEMTVDLNRNFLLPLGQLQPQVREVPGSPRNPILPMRESGPEPGNALVSCATCHNGAPKPFGGDHTLAAYPGLRGTAAGATPPAPTPTAAPNPNG